MNNITKLAILEGLDFHRKKLEEFNDIPTPVNQIVDALTKMTYFMAECVQEITKETK